jgi:hypothetical protein
MNHSSLVALPVEAVAVHEDRQLDSLRNSRDWFLAVTDCSGVASYYAKDELATSLHSDILAGRYRNTDEVVIHSKAQDGAWKETKSTLSDFAGNHFALRTLYEPVWAYALAGLKWGAVVGIGLKLLDTFILFASVNPALGFLFAVAVGVCFIPRIGTAGVIVLSIAMARFTKVNLFFAGIGAALVGAALGCLPGMAIGGIVGFVRSASLPRASDAPAERPGLYLKAIVLPGVAGIALLVFYFSVVTPWLAGLLE